MCGICGEIDFDNGVMVEPIQRMCRTLTHRGPDDEGIIFGRGNQFIEMKGPSESLPKQGGFEVALGHRRLSIIDLSYAGHQPMCNEDGRIWIVFNGEIYNFQELQQRLEEEGHRFKSESDTEVILHAYEEWGIGCLNLFRGMFAFAIWDCKLQRLFMARDRLGEKPLVYCRQNGRFVFASEIKALLQLPNIERKVNNIAIHHYLTYQYVPAPDTIFAGINKLPPAHYLLYERKGGLKIERYWRLKFNPSQKRHGDLRELTGEIRTKIEESVKLRLISDVPLGAFLSGGIDSSVVVGTMAKLSDRPIKTFSIGFEEEDFNELPYARLVAEHFGTDHHEFLVRPNAIEILPKLVWHYDEPFADSSAIPTYYVAKMTRDYVTVVLTGDAADENFAGYHRYLWSKWVALFSKIPKRMWKGYLPFLLRMVAGLRWKETKLNRLANYIESVTINQVKNYGEQVKIFNAGEKESLYSREFEEVQGGAGSFEYFVEKCEDAGTKDLIEQLLYLDINTYLPEDLLVKVDIATMANSLEARVPFLDHLLMEFVASIPSRLKLRGKTTKYILKKAYSDFLPKEILSRRKRGFAVPVARWFKNEMRNYVRDVLFDSRSLQRGYFRKAGLERLLREHEENRYDHSSKIWALLFLEEWFRMFMDRREVPAWME